MDIGVQLLVDGAAAALLCLTVILILRGYLVPRSVLNDVKADRDYWRSTAQEAAKQNGQLLESARVTEALMRAIAADEEEGP